MDRSRYFIRVAGTLSTWYGGFGLVMAVGGALYALLEPSEAFPPLFVALYVVVSGAYHGLLLAAGLGLRKVAEPGRKFAVLFLLTNIALHAAFSALMLFTVFGPPPMHLPAFQLVFLAVFTVALQALLWRLVFYLRSARIRLLFQAA